MKTRYIAVILLAVLLVGCTASQLVRNLELVVNAVSISLPVIGQTAGIDPAVIQMIEKYLSSVNDAAQQADAELQTADPPALKSSKIVIYFSTAIAPNLPPGIPQRVVSVVQAVVQAVANFLAQLPKPAAFPGQNVEIRLTTKDVSKLSEISRKSLQNREALAKLKH